MLCGLYVTCFGASPREARRAARRAKGLMRGVVGATPASGLGHQQPLYMSTLPGVDTARRVWRMHAETAANTFPYNRSNPSTRRGYEIGTTERGELVRLDPADQSLRNALLVIFGLSGMGKTSFTLKLLLLHLLAGGRVTVMDRSGHYGPLCALARGVTVETAEELERVPLACPMVVVDLRKVPTVTSELRAAVDRRVQLHDNRTRHGQEPTAVEPRAVRHGRKRLAAIGHDPAACPVNLRRADDEGRGAHLHAAEVTEPEPALNVAAGSLTRGKES